MEESASGSDKIQWVIENIIKEYNDRGGVQVEAIVQPEIWTATSTALSGGSGPDVVFTPGPTFAMELAKSDRLASLDSYAEEFGWADRFFPWALGLGTVNDTLYSIPSEVETMVLYYNADLFEEHGWTPPTTIDELIALADQVNEAGIVPFAHTNAEWRPANEHYMCEFLNKIAGPENVYKALHGELPWTDQVFVDALVPLNEFQAKGYFSGGLDRYYTTASADASANLAHGDAAMKIDGSWFVPDANNFFEESGMRWDWVPMPSKDGTPSFDMAICSTYSINAASQYQKEVGDFLDFYFSEETQAKIRVGAGMDTAPITIEPSLVEGLDEREERLVAGIAEAAESGNCGYTTWTFFPPRTQVYMYESIEKVWAGDLTKDGARFNFSLPGSVQGFMADNEAELAVSNTDGKLRLEPASDDAQIATTPTFIPEEARDMKPYRLIASPTLHSGQTVKAIFSAPHGEATLALIARKYGEGDAIVEIVGPSVSIASGETTTIEWTVPDTNGQPILSLGLKISGGKPVEVDSIAWSGAPTVSFNSVTDATMWRQAWVDGVQNWSAHWMANPYTLGQDEGIGLLSQGTEDWADYEVSAQLSVPLAASAGITGRVGGMKRYYAFTICNDDTVKITCMNNTGSTLAEAPFKSDPDTTYSMSFRLNGDTLIGSIDGKELVRVQDSTFDAGAAGFLIEEGSLIATTISVNAI